jgi:activating signal cointegrator complex subunit 3
LLPASLLAYLGDACVEVVYALVGARSAVATALRPRLEALKTSLSGGDAAATSSSMFSAPAAGVTIVSAAAREAEKAARKESKRRARQAHQGNVAADPLLDWLAAAGVPFGAVLAADGAAWAAPAPPREADPLAALYGTGDALRATALPAGAVRITRPGYEQVSVPAATPGVPAPGEVLFPIASMAPWERLAFAGFTSLNRIQSAIEPVARRGAANLLVSAPTGAGKTNIAMLTVLRELALRRAEAGADAGGAAMPVFDASTFKIVYVAPMKALAAEVASAFAKRLGPLGLRVRELTGDMQLTRRELDETHMLVTTPEKWDVVTRKGGEAGAAGALALLILDEVHLLADERGGVLEALVSRTRRQVEAQQRPIRIVALSATLPNPDDVAEFLGAPPEGRFVFDASFRPVPLAQRFIGVSESNPMRRSALMTELAYNEAVAAVRNGKQAMVFVHSRADTGRTARALADAAALAGDGDLFALTSHPEADLLMRDIGRCRDRSLAELAPKGFGVHHAGMPRPDRSLAERLFSRGALKVLVCTATLAWGVNLPAHTVVIKGTQIYDAQRGGFKDLGVLDVAQIFGRAGRPQFDTSGEGVIITEHRSLAHYLGMLTARVPIESRFLASLRDALNAEVVLGTVTTVAEGASWLGYTFLHVRARKNPLAYALTWADVAADPALAEHRRRLIREAARGLDAAKMVRFDERAAQIYTTDAGRVAAHFYLRAASMEAYHEALQPGMSLPAIFAMLAHSSEFENLAPREEEMPELEELAASPACPVDVRSALSTRDGKAAVLIQAYISRARLEAHSLSADTAYVAQSVVRIARALAELVLRRGWPGLALAMLRLATAAERRVWPQQHPLRQFEPPAGAHGARDHRGGAGGALPQDVLMRLEEAGEAASLDRLIDMSAADLGRLSRSNAVIGARIADAVASFPRLELSATVQPITRSVLRVSLTVAARFVWRDAAHGASLRWHIWVEDQSNEHIYHQELLSLSKRSVVVSGGAQLAFTIPIFEPMPPQYYVRAVCESWLGAEAVLELSLRDVVLPGGGAQHTELLPLRPLPRSALRCASYEALYAHRFSHFNAIQTQAFHSLYNTDDSVLLGAPTGSGKTVSSELALLRAFRTRPGSCVLYIAPLKALVRERVADWRKGLCAALRKTLVELTGDAPADGAALARADLVVATPEKWDAVSRAWGDRAYVQRISLLVIDEIHLLGGDRGPVLEVLVSRMRYIAARTGTPLRIVGLTTCLANAGDLADWLAVPPSGRFNFRPSCRPVPLEAHIQGYPGRFYCPRMASMNKPTYAAIKAHAADAPALVFVASRRQTRLTALELLALAAGDDAPPRFLRAPPEEASTWAAVVRDPALAHALSYGVGMHHAGLCDSDRELVEALFLRCAIHVLVCTATLAWGVNLPAHLVVIKGTEFYDGAQKRYVDFPITDVLQMMGRAGRPQFDTSGVCVILVHEPKKAFYKKFLYEPFPVESSLASALADPLNAEVAAGTVRSAQDGVDWLTWTFLFRRALANPSYYGLRSGSPDDVDEYLSGLVQDALAPLRRAGCIELLDADESMGDEPSLFGDDAASAADVAPAAGWRQGGAAQRPSRGCGVRATGLGRVAAQYYLKHQSAATLAAAVAAPSPGPAALLRAVAACAEFDELPVRHNEDLANTALAKQVSAARGWPTDTRAPEAPATKAHLLLQCHLLRLAPPIADYATDARGVLDNAARLLPAALDAAALAGAAPAAAAAALLCQCVAQARHPAAFDTSAALSLAALPHVGREAAERLRSAGVADARALATTAQAADGNGPARAAAALAAAGLAPAAAKEAAAVAARMPLLQLHASLAPASPDTLQLSVRIARLGRPTAGPGGGGGAPRAHAPGSARPRTEAWWLLADDARTGALHALKRLTLRLAGGADASAAMLLPREAAEAPGAALRLRCISDCYLGFDAVLQITGSAPDEALPQAEPAVEEPAGEEYDDEAAAEADWAARQEASADGDDADAPDGACGA